VPQPLAAAIVGWNHWYAFTWSLGGICGSIIMPANVKRLQDLSARQLLLRPLLAGHPLNLLPFERGQLHADAEHFASVNLLPFAAPASAQKYGVAHICHIGKLTHVERWRPSIQDCPACGMPLLNTDR
jgi:hypothetical protein